MSAGGLTQAELVRRAGTSQSTSSAYERRNKAPLLASEPGAPLDRSGAQAAT
jgi:transcriptional regulator with XRE-family HTH domain